MEINFFDKKIEKSLKSLRNPERTKVLRALDLLKRFGRNLCMPHSKYLEDNLFELRTRGGKEVRILYTINKNEALLLSVFIKKTQKTPRRELIKARRKIKSLMHNNI